GIITPWNFPIAIPAWKIAPALAYGNTVVFKPADLVPGSAWALAEILGRAGLPAGTFNLVMGRGRDIGDALLNDPSVAAVTFTGSEATGRKVAQACIARSGPIVRFQLELGGKNPRVVLVDGKPGFYLQPALFTEANNAMRICREEIFGPVASVIRVKDADEALAVANDTAFGLSAGVCTTSLKHAAHFKRHLQAGMVMVNA